MSRLSDLAATLEPARVLARSGLLGPLRPDKYLHMASVVRQQGMTSTTGVSLAARRCPDRTALIDERGSLTWRELDRRADALAVALEELLGPERRIGLLARNHRGFVETLVAAGKLGADLVLLNTAFAGPQLLEVLAREPVDVLVHDEEYADALAEIPQPTRRVIAWQSGAASELTVDGLIAAHVGQTPATPTSTPRIVLLTSGTTGTPKGARRGAGGSASQLVAAIERVPWRTEDTVVIAAPMFHAWGFGCLVLAATMANTIVMRRHFGAEETLALMAEHRAGGLAVVPVMINRIAALPAEVKDKYDCRTLRFVTASGSAMEPASVLSFMDRFGDVVHSHYNATEAGMIAIATPADLRADPRSAGMPARGCSIRILDENDRPVGPGVVGQIAVSNDTLFDGYTNGGGKESREGFMLTGDLGRLDPSGRLLVEGRVDDMVICGGENVYPDEVEAALAQHPQVVEAAVIGVPDAEFGQRLRAYVVLAHAAGINSEHLRDYVRSTLASYKVPREVVLLDELPRNATGKVVKSLLPD